MVGYCSITTRSARSERTPRSRGTKSKGLGCATNKYTSRQASLEFSKGGTGIIFTARPGAFGGYNSNEFKILLFRSGSGGGIGRYSLRCFDSKGSVQYGGTLTINGLIGMADLVNANTVLNNMVIARCIAQTDGTTDFSTGTAHSNATYLTGGAG